MHIKSVHISSKSDECAKEGGLSGVCWNVFGLITASDTLLSSHLCRVDSAAENKHEDVRCGLEEVC